MVVKLNTSPMKNIQDLIRRTGRVITHPIRQQFEDFFAFPRSNQATQLLLAMKYKDMVTLGLPLPTLDEVDFRAYSQFGEDGILLYLFSVLGTTNKKCVEICGGGGYDNTTNLIVNHGWHGLFFDGDEKDIQQAQLFFGQCTNTRIWPPKLVCAWITTENINQLLEEQGYTGEIDLLSLDMDGIDYWIWKAIECIRPRVVVLEYNAALGPDASLTVPYEADFVTKANSVSKLRFLGRRVTNTFVEKPLVDRIDHYFGASLSAFVKLGKQKGYRLVGCVPGGYNAFFVRSDIGDKIIPEVTPSECFKHPFNQYLAEIRGKTVVHKKWVEV